MIGGPGPDEPDEFDPLEDIGPDIPEVSIPEPETPDPSEVDGSKEVVRLFWKLVVVFDLAILAMALGVLFVVFESDLRRGVPIFLVGAGSFAYGYLQYRSYRRRQD